MRVLVLISLNSHKDTAGVRIRYQRFRGSGSDFDIQVEAIDNLSDGALLDADVYIFSKTYSTAAGVIAKRLVQEGKTVGVDLFDDYFSQVDDPRLLRFRSWLNTFGPVFSFALCSTSAMERIVRGYRPDLPVFVLPDPYPELDTLALQIALMEKLDRVRTTGILDLVWFGIGSNPFFPVGLRDLAAYSESLAELARGDYRVRLVVLTDRNSLTPANLARLAKLPTSCRIAEWSIEAEERLLRSAFAAFIPVNGQSFSRAKSMNRALTAIVAGNQVLSPGFPLYRDIDDFVYGRASSLLADIAHGECRINSGNVAEMARHLADHFGIKHVVGSLHGFLQSAATEPRKQEPMSGSAATQGFFLVSPVPELALMHGLEIDPTSAAGARSAGILSIKTPLTRHEHGHDIRIDHVQDDQVEVWLRPELKALVSYKFRQSCSEAAKVGKQKMIKVAAREASRLKRKPAIDPKDLRWPIYETAAYRDFLLDIAQLCRLVFPTVELHLSDPNPYGRATLVPTQPSGGLNDRGGTVEAR